MNETTTQIYPAQVEENMQYFYNSLSEKDKRHYAAVEAIKLGHGGISYIAQLLGCSRQTIHVGVEELKKRLYSKHKE